MRDEEIRALTQAQQAGMVSMRRKLHQIPESGVAE